MALFQVGERECMRACVHVCARVHVCICGVYSCTHYKVCPNLQEFLNKRTPFFFFFFNKTSVS